MNRTVTISISIAALLLGRGRAFGDWIYNPGTGHWYSLTATELNWTDAENAAVAAGGHLVTLNDSAENDWILAQVGKGQASLWIGLYQVQGGPEPAGGWVWVNGEPVIYTNWGTGEPNNDGGSENFGDLLGPQNPDPGKWNDSRDAFPLHAGVIEREFDPAVPTVSEWGLIVMTCLTLAAGTMILMRTRRAPA